MSTISFGTATKLGQSYNKHSDNEHELDHLPPLSAGPAFESMHSTIRQPRRKGRKPHTSHSGDSLGSRAMKRASHQAASDDPLRTSSLTPSWWPTRSTKPVYAQLSGEEADLGDLSTRPETAAGSTSAQKQHEQYDIPPPPLYDVSSSEHETTHGHGHGHHHPGHPHGSGQCLPPLLPESVNGWIKALTNSIQSLLPASHSHSHSHAEHSHSHSHSHVDHGRTHVHGAELPPIPSASDWGAWNDLCFQPCLNADGTTCKESYRGAAMSHSHI